MSGTLILIIVAAVMFAVIGGITLLSHLYSLNNIKSKTGGDGQHGTARFLTKGEQKRAYKHIPYTPQEWRKNKGSTTLEPGVIVGVKKKRGKNYAMVDTSDVHTMMIGAAGCVKTAFWLYPNLEYACASGMSFLTTDTKGDLYRNYGNIAKDYYGYNVAVIDLRNPTRSDGNNLLHLVNKYMDLYKENPEVLSYKAKEEKYAKIIAKTLIFSEGDSASYGQNAFFYDAAEGLMTASILLVAEFVPKEQRHIVSVFKLIQDLLGSSKIKGKNKFQMLMELLPPEHKTRWFAMGIVTHQTMKSFFFFIRNCLRGKKLIGHGYTAL